MTPDDDPVHPVAFPLPASTFVNGASLLTSSEPVTVRTIEIGYLNLPSGRVVATGPFSHPEREPFTARVAPGSYPVVLWGVRRRREGDVADDRLRRNRRGDRVGDAVVPSGPRASPDDGAACRSGP